MTLTEVTTDFTSEAALGSCFSPGVHSSKLGCLLGNPGVLPSSSSSQPSASPTPSLPAPLTIVTAPAGPREGEEPSETSKGLILFWVVSFLTIVTRRLGCSLACVRSR